MVHIEMQTFLEHMQGCTGPSVLLFKVVPPSTGQEYLFGAYVTHRWRLDGERFGSPKCFLFSVTLDLKFPYHGRQKDTQTDTQPGMAPEHDCVRASSSLIQLGLRDLLISQDFDACSSELEYSYGVGLKPGSKEAASMLCGSSLFSIAQVEAWSVH